MQWNATVTFEADSEQAVADAVNSWGLTPGSTVVVAPVVAPIMGTVDASGTVVTDAPVVAPMPSPAPGAEPKT